MSLRRVYDDFEPTTEWASEEGFATLLVFLPGFKREEIKVQITAARNLRIMGERQIGENHLSRFRKEVPISSNHDTHRITARFDNGILYVKHPEMIIPAEPEAGKDEEAKPKPTAETQKPPEPKPELQRAEGDERKKEVKESPKPLEPTSKPGKEEKLEEVGGAIGPRSMPPIQRRKKAEKERKPSELVHGSDRRPRTEDGSGSSERKMKSHQKSIRDIIVKLKKYGNIINLVVAGLLALVLALYIKYTIISSGTARLGSLEGQED